MSMFGEKPWWATAPDLPSEPPGDPEADELDEIIDEIWTDPNLLLDALQDCDPRLPANLIVHLHAEKVQKERRAMAQPEGER